MNRILQADVILTLTREQTEALFGLVEQRHPAVVGWTDLEAETLSSLREQCAKQGVQL